MIDFHVSEYVPEIPGFRIVPEADVIHVGLSAHLDPWLRELVMAHVTRVVTGEVSSKMPADATVIPFPTAANG